MPVRSQARADGATSGASSSRLAGVARLALSAVAGVLLFLSAPHYDAWPLMWIALAPQIDVALASRTPRRAFLQGWLTGTVANTFAFSWMGSLLQRFGHMPAIEAVPIMMLLTGYQGLEFALFSWGVRRARDRLGDGVPLAVLAPLVMVTIELVMPQIFPYYLAISQAWVPLVIQVADLTGPMGVTALMAAFNGALVDAYVRTRAGWGARVAFRPLAFALALFAADLGYGAIRLHQVDVARAAAPKVKTGLVQANVGILEKWDPQEFARLLDTHQRVSAELARAGADFIVWPESSYSYALPRTIAHELPEGDQRRVRAGFDTPLMFGAVTYTPGHVGAASPPAERYPYNTALMMDAAGNVTGKYDKVFLMLFGEYIPFYDSIPWFTKIFPEASNFNRGVDPASFPLRVRDRDYKLGPLICYEDILPSFTRRVARLSPNAFVNITNDAWFGATDEPHQHLALAVFRSIESRLEMVRAVNTGVSAHVDAAGRVLAQTSSVDPAETPDAPPASLLVDLAMLPGGGLYRHIGDLFGFACALALVALLVRASPRRPYGA
ncbi:MAG TPA: apolipoprotein N-acyltransferase [Polyangia bacterium]|nr:apolipoprotein N-acyltransferase [Polyangia bacterium]